MAEFMGGVIQEVINAAPTLSTLWETMPFDENSNPSIPLDLYLDVTEQDYIRVWSQAEAGGLPFNMPVPPTKELKFMTYTLDSAIAFHKKYAMQSRLEVVAKSMTRLAQEVMLKQDYNAAAVLLKALAETTSVVNGATTNHVIRSQRANEFLLHDLNRLFTLIKRIRSAWNQGTPDRGQAYGLTDLLVSPEIVQYIRSMAYNPVNTRGGVVTGTGGQSESAVTLTEDVRRQILSSAGVPEFFGVSIHEFNELGVGNKWNTLFDSLAGSTSYPAHVASGSAGVFDGANEEILIGLDLGSVSSLIRPVATSSDKGSEFTVVPDNQFVDRSGKIGFYGSLEEGRVILDSKVLVGVIV
jgi:hypothetical protein